MQRCFFVALSCFWLALSGVDVVSAGAIGRPNVLFIAVDDLRPQLCCYGDPLVRTPNIDRLAARGLVFNRAYCQQALCAPSRVSMMTGRYCATTGIYSIGPTLRSKLPDVVTMPQFFKQHGWFTRSLGKLFHVGIDDPQSWSVPSWQPSKPRYGPEGMTLVNAAATKTGQPATKLGGRNLPFYAGPAFEAPEVADEELADGDTACEAVAALGELAQKPDQPFWLGVGFLNPHLPWIAPKKYWDLYKPQNIKLPDNRYPPRGAPAFAAKTGTDFTWYSNVPDDGKITDELAHRCLHGYLAAISYIDACVGRVLDEMDRLKLWNNTIVVFWSDHGYYMGEHNWFGGKHNNYEGATRIPLIVAAPGMKAAGHRTDALVESVDIYPTLVELAGLSIPAGVEGVSLKPLLDNSAEAWQKTGAFSEYLRDGFLGTAMRTDRYRYVEWKDPAGTIVAVELYDHQSDPQENENVANKADKSLLEVLAKQMRTQWKHATR